MKAIVLPEGPPCTRCGHPPCSGCEVWRDILDCKECGLDTDNTECVYDAEEHQAWLESISSWRDYENNGFVRVYSREFKWRPVTIP